MTVMIMVIFYIIYDDIVGHGLVEVIVNDDFDEAKITSYLTLNRFVLNTFHKNANLKSLLN